MMNLKPALFAFSIAWLAASATAQSPENWVPTDGITSVSIGITDVFWTVSDINCPGGEFAQPCEINRQNANVETYPRRSFRNNGPSADNSVHSANVTNVGSNIYYLGANNVYRVQVFSYPPVPPPVAIANLANNSGGEIAADEAYVYWTENTGATGRLYRTPTAGTGFRELMFTTSGDGMRQLKADGEGGVLFVSGQIGFDIDVLHRVTDTGASFNVETGAGLVESYAVDDGNVYTITGIDSTPRTLGRAPLNNIAGVTPGISLSVSLDGSVIDELSIDEQHIYYYRDRPGGNSDFIYRLDKDAWDSGTPVAITNSVDSISSLIGSKFYLFWLSGSGGIDRLKKEDAQAIETDLSIDRVEVVQSVQTLGNTERLIADRPTTVRVYPKLNSLVGAGSVTATVTLTGELFNGSAVLLPAIPTRTIVMTTASMLDRTDLSSTVNFELPSAWTQDNIRLQAVIEPLAMRDTTPADNTYIEEGFLENGLFFAPKTHVCIKFLPLQTTAGLTYRVFEPGTFDYTPGFLDIVNRFESLYATRGLRFYTRAVALRKPEFLGFPQPFNMQDAADSDHLMAALWEHNLFDTAPETCGGDNARTHYVAMVHPGIATGERIGMGRFAEPLSWGVMLSGGTGPGAHRGGSIIAHELGHNTNTLIGDSDLWQHVNCGLPEDSGFNDVYPYRDNSIGVERDTGNFDPFAGWGFDRLSNTVIPPDTAADYMSYCTPWVSDYRWNAVFATTNERSGFRGSTTENAVPTTDTLGLFGLLNSAETAADILAAYLVPLVTNIRIPAIASKATSAASPTPAGVYTVELVDADGNVLNVQPIEPVASADDLDNPGFVFFTTLAWDDESTALRVRKDDAEVLASHAISATAPEITITAPLPGAVLEDGALISWTASDADGDDLQYLIQYSNNGEDWSQLAERLTDTSFEIASIRELFSGSNGHLRVVATDGVRLAIATITPLQVAAHPPIPVIVSPGRSAAFTVSDTITVRARAGDPDTLPEDISFQWRVNGQDSMQTGDTLVLGDLRPGEYTALLTVVDDTQNAREAARDFTVMPKFVPATAAPAIDGLCTDDVYNQDTQALKVGYLNGDAPAFARTVRDAQYVYFCISGLRVTTELANNYVSLQFNADTSDDSTPEVGDNRIDVDGAGTLSRWQGFNGSWQQTNVASAFEAVPLLDDEDWSVELRVTAALVGPVGGLGSVRIEHGDVQLLPPEKAQWPLESAIDNPATFGVFALGRQDQTIDFDDVRIIASTQPVDLQVTASSMLPPEFSAQPESVCTITTGGALVPGSNGRCTVTVMQQGNELYNPAPGVTREIQIYAQDCLSDTDCDGDGVGDATDNCAITPNVDQIDADADGFGNRCDFDYNNDCIVNIVDLGLLRTAFFSTDAIYDSNSDGVVNIVDLGALRTGFFLPPGPSLSNPQCL